MHIDIKIYDLNNNLLIIGKSYDNTTPIYATCIKNGIANHIIYTLLGVDSNKTDVNKVPVHMGSRVTIEPESMYNRFLILE